MAPPLIETKLRPPRAGGRLVARQRLIEQMRGSSGAALTLVSAPVGFGKSTLIAGAFDDAVARGAAGAWLSLDPTDDDSLTFWTYVVAALDRASPGLGKRVAARLEAAEATQEAAGSSIGAALTVLLNDLAELQHDVVLVLDDLHVLEDRTIYEQLGFVLDHLPPHAHVIVGTRSDPPIPVARLRAKGGLVEIRAADLRFTEVEAATYLTEAMGLSLGEASVTALEARTEGWIAALQLAALSLRGRDDAVGFIDRFAGDDRYIVDYLVEEVLAVQSDEVRGFLLSTSILARMTAPLVEAVTGRPGGQAALEALDRANLFVVALDDQRRWYRYHQLFAEVLRAHLVAERPEQVASLHRLASDWFEAHDDRAEAIHHALAGKNPERAAELIERSIPELRRMRREPTFVRFADALPDDIFATRPVLAVGYAGALLSTGRPDRVAELLAAAEPWLTVGTGQGTRPDGMIVVDEAELRQAPAMLELYRAALAKVGGDLAGNMAHARRVLDLVDASDHLARGGAEAFLGLAHWELGELDPAVRWYTEAMASLERAGHVTDVVGGAITTADLLLAQGRLRDAESVYRDGLERGTRAGTILRGVADMHVGLATTAYERGDLHAAEAQLDAAERLGAENGFPRYPYRSRLARARLVQAQGDLDRALDLMSEAERRFDADFSPDLRPIAAQRARLLIAHGRIAEARAWARTRGLVASEEPTYPREYELLTLARLLTAEGMGSEAVGLTRRLLAVAEEAGRGGGVLEALIVDALARHATDDIDGALATLNRAVAFAEPEGFARTFLDEGPAMTSLLRVAARRRDAPAFIQTLLAVGAQPDRPAPAQHGLVEPLSQREIEVLRLLRSDLDGPDVARELVVSVNTLRTHTKNIYAKLGVTSRRAAVRRAEELGLL